LHQKGDGTLKEIGPDLLLEWAEEVVRDHHGQVLQSSQDHGVLVHNHVHPIAREHRLLMWRHQLLEYEKDLYDKVL